MTYATVMGIHEQKVQNNTAEIATAMATELLTSKTFRSSVEHFKAMMKKMLIIN